MTWGGGNHGTRGVALGGIPDSTLEPQGLSTIADLLRCLGHLVDFAAVIGLVLRASFQIKSTIAAIEARIKEAKEEEAEVRWMS